MRSCPDSWPLSWSSQAPLGYHPGSSRFHLPSRGTALRAQWHLRPGTFLSPEVERSHLSTPQALRLPGPSLALPGPQHLSQNTAPRGHRGLCPGSDHPPNPTSRHLPFSSVRGRSEQLRAKLPNTLPSGPAPGEEPRQLLGWGGVSPTLHSSEGLSKSPIPPEFSIQKPAF